MAAAAAAVIPPTAAEKSVRVEERQYSAGERGQPVSSSASLKLVVRALDHAEINDRLDTNYSAKLAQGMAYPNEDKRVHSWAPGMVIIRNTKDYGSGNMISACACQSAYNGATFEEAVNDFRVIGQAEGKFLSDRSADDQTEDQAQTVLVQGQGTIQNLSKSFIPAGAAVGFRPPSVVKQTARAGHTVAAIKVLPACVGAADFPTAFRPEPYEIKLFGFVEKFTDAAFRILGDGKADPSASNDPEVKTLGEIFARDRPGDNEFKEGVEKLKAIFAKEFPELSVSSGLTNICSFLALLLFRKTATASLALEKPKFFFNSVDGKVRSLTELEAEAAAAHTQPIEAAFARGSAESLKWKMCLGLLRIIGENLRDMYEMQQLNISCTALNDSEPGKPLDVLWK